MPDFKVAKNINSARKMYSANTPSKKFKRNNREVKTKIPSPRTSEPQKKIDFKVQDSLAAEYLLTPSASEQALNTSSVVNP